MNIYRDCFIDKLYYKMLIHKLIAFLRKDTFFVLFYGYYETQPNIVVKTNKYDFDYIYIYIYIYIFSKYLQEKTTICDN